MIHRFVQERSNRVRMFPRFYHRLGDFPYHERRSFAISVGAVCGPMFRSHRFAIEHAQYTADSAHGRGNDLLLANHGCISVRLSGEDE